MKKEGRKERKKDRKDFDLKTNISHLKTDLHSWYTETAQCIVSAQTTPREATLACIQPVVALLVLCASQLV